jgi:hypothetical protein
VKQAPARDAIVTPPAALVLAWDAESPVNTIAGTDEVTTMAALHGTTAIGTGVGTTKPKLIPNVMNGYPVVRFTGTSEYFTMPDFLHGPGVTAAHIFALLRTTLDPQPTLSKTGLWNFSDVSESSHYRKTDTNVIVGFGFRFVYGNLANDLAEFHVLEIQHDAAGTRAFIDNASVFTNGTFPESDNWIAAPQFGKSLGAHYFAGDLSTMRIYGNGILSASERTGVYAFLNAKKGSA